MKKLALIFIIAVVLSSCSPEANIENIAWFDRGAVDSSTIRDSINIMG